MTSDSVRASVLTIGDELLSGEVIDTNFSYIATSLRALGLTVHRSLTVADDIDDIAEALRELCALSDFVAVTGGLGPTSDDLTAEAVAKAAGRELVFHPHLEKNLARVFEAMGRPMAPENLKQAYLPHGSVEIPAAGGTATGFVLEQWGALIAVMPGVPGEMQEMMSAHIVPELKRRFSGREVTVSRSLMTFGAGESDIANRVKDLIGMGAVRYGFIAQGGPIVVKLSATGATEDEVSEVLDREQGEVEERLGSLLYGVDGQFMEDVLGRLLQEAGLTVAVAESLTAGIVCARITEVPGSSRYFRGGVVTYSNQSKVDILGLAPGLLADGAVGTCVAEGMARSVREMFGADIGISTTGIAGPGSGGERKPVGTACVAIDYADGAFSVERRLPGSRKMVRSIAATAALNLVRLYLLDARSKSH